MRDKDFEVACVKYTKLDTEIRALIAKLKEMPKVKSIELTIHKIIKQ